MDAPTPHETHTRTVDLGDISALRQYVESLQQAGRSGDAINLLLDAVVRLQRKVAILMARLAKAVNRAERRRLELLLAAQQQLMLELGQLQLAGLGAETKPDTSITPAAAPAAPEASPPAPKSEKKRTHRGRQTLPAHLPRVVVTVPVADGDRTCAVHGVEKHLVRTEQSAVLDYVPGHFQVTEIHREVRACRPCNGGVVIAPVADKVIDGGLPGPGLLAEVVVRKYGEHMPLERMSKSFARDGVHLAPSTLGDWVTAAATALEPIVKRIESLVFASFVMSADPTSVRVLDRNEPTGRRFGQLWGMIGDGELALIKYTSDQKGETIETLLSPRIGYLQLDGALGFNALFEGPAPPVRVRIGCQAHAIRKFQAAQEAGDVRAIVGLSLIGKLYDIEKRATEDGVDTDARTRRRDTAARPILEELHAWLETTRPQLPPKTPLGTAVGYASNQWDSLVRYVEDGRIPIDNNHVERLHRAPGIGRRNWLFCGNDAGAKRAATLYTVLANCGLHDIEPAEYLRDVLWKLATGWPASRLDELLPNRWKVARDAARPATDPR